MLTPFSLKQWLRWLFIVWLAGYSTFLNGGGTSALPNRQVPERAVQSESAPSQSETVSEQKAGLEQFSNTNLVVVLFVSLAALLLLLIFLWLSARFSFIFLDVLTHPEHSIASSFQNFRSLANSYFIWSMGLIGAVLATLLITMGAVQWARPVAWIFVLGAVFVVLGCSFIGFIFRDFVVPIMFHDQLGTWDAWSQFWRVKPPFGELLLYILLRLGLGIVAGIAILILGTLMRLVLFGVGLTIAFFGGIVMSWFPAFASFFDFLTGAGTIVLAIAIMLGIGLAALPVAIFFRLFSIYYLKRFNLPYVFFADAPEGAR